MDTTTEWNEDGDGDGKRDESASMMMKKKEKDRFEQTRKELPSSMEQLMYGFVWFCVVLSFDHSNLVRLLDLSSEAASLSQSRLSSSWLT
jgi:hypothetical protein